MLCEREKKGKKAVITEKLMYIVPTSTTLYYKLWYIQADEGTSKEMNAECIC
jgi:hypothetical protein